MHLLTHKANYCIYYLFAPSRFRGGLHSHAALLHTANTPMHNVKRYGTSALCVSFRWQHQTVLVKLAFLIRRNCNETKIEKFDNWTTRIKQNCVTMTIAWRYNGALAMALYATRHSICYSTQNSTVVALHSTSHRYSTLSQRQHYILWFSSWWLVVFKLVRECLKFWVLPEFWVWCGSQLTSDSKRAC